MPGKAKQLVVYGVVLVLLIAGWLALRHRKNREPDAPTVPRANVGPDSHIYDAFAQCLAAKHVKMYGLFWCPHCADQKAEFGASFQYVPYVECTTHESPHELTPECKAAGVKLFPSWQFGTDPPKEGVLTLQQLSEKTACSLP
jgi:hypothetical protein